MLAAVVACWALVAAPAGGSEPDGQVVDLVVARVNDAVITLSELVAQTGIVLLQTRGPDVAMNAPLTPDLLASVLELMVNEILLHQEVRRLRLFEISEGRVLATYQREVAVFEDTSSSVSFAETYGFEVPGGGEPPPLWATIIRRRLAVESFLASRARLEIRPTPAVVLRCYEANAAYFAPRSFGDAEPEIRERIQQQQAARTAERLVRDLRRRARLRFSRGFDPGPPRPASEGGPFTCPLEPEG